MTLLRTVLSMQPAGRRTSGNVRLRAVYMETTIFSYIRSHIFDGVAVTKETAAFQLCDIHDPMLKEMIEDEGDLRETCDVSLSLLRLLVPLTKRVRPQERDGWYSTRAFERIKTVLRHKFFALLGGHIATREECEALLVPQEGTNKLPPRPIQRLRVGRHNMAKGALPPEDVAVSPSYTLFLTSDLNTLFPFDRPTGCWRP